METIKIEKPEPIEEKDVWRHMLVINTLIKLQKEIREKQNGS